MPVELFPLPHIDNLAIPENIINKCKISYENNGKESAYKTMDKLLYSEVPSQTLRSLYLYRKAMYLSKSAYIMGDGYIEKELIVGQNNKFNIRDIPLWKRQRWTFLDKDATVKIKRQNENKYDSESQFTLDDYNKDYPTLYNENTTMTLKGRGGRAAIRRTRFDFEYKYSSVKEYNNLYFRYIYNTFKRVISITCKDGVYTSLSYDDIDNIQSIISLLPSDIKISIIKNVRDFVLDERINKNLLSLPSIYENINNAPGLNNSLYNNSSQSAYSINNNNHRDIRVIGDQVFQEIILQSYEEEGDYDYLYSSASFIEFLSKMHDILLLPIEYISYIIVALVNPRHEAIFIDKKGNIGSHLFSGNVNITPDILSTIGPSKINGSDDLVSVLAPNIPLVHKDDITLFESLFITSNQDYDISCFSFNKNCWITDIPLVDKTNISFINFNKARKLLSIIPVFDLAGQAIIWFIYSDCIISYNASAHKWISKKDDDPYHIDILNLNSLFPIGNECVFSIYDKENSLILFIDNYGNIASHDIIYGESTPYNSTQDNPEATIHFNMEDNNNQIIKSNKMIILDSKSEYSLLIYNDKLCQIVNYSEENGLIKKFQFDYASEDSNIVDVIKLNDEKKIYIIYSDHKIIELSTYLYIPILFQKSNLTSFKVVTANKSYLTINESPVYITSDNRLNIIHQIYNIEDRVSKMDIDFDKYISEGNFIKSYNEYFIQSSSITLFTNSYYALSNYIDKARPVLSKRT
jgi:hypothetical protein